MPSFGLTNLEDFLKSNITVRTLKYYLRIAFRYRKMFIFNIFAVSIGIVLGQIVATYFLAKLFAQLADFGSTVTSEHLYKTAGLIVVVKLGEVTFFRLNDYTTIRRSAKTLRDLEQFVFRKLQAHSYRFYSDNFAGSLVTQALRFVKSFQDLEFTFFFNLLGSIIKIVFAVGVLLFIAPLLGISLLVWALIFITSVTCITIKKSSITRKAAVADSEVTANVADVITNMINVKIFARHEYEQNRFKQVSEKRFEKRWRSMLYDAHIRSYRWALLLGFYFLFVYLSVYSVVTNQATVTAVAAAQLYLLMIYSDMFDLNQTIQRVELALSDAAEMTETLDLEPEVKDPVNPEQITISQGSITFDRVNFRYSDAGNEVLNDFSLVIPAGQKVGLVGHSGSGKSTLTRLLMRFADLQSGKIIIDGQDVSHLAQDDLRAQIAFVPQEPILFHRTLMENIRYGRVDATDEEVFDAARLAHASEFINMLPERYDTLVGERGVKLSGGEKQRVAIARAMLCPAPMLLLDEATSALDSKSEKLIIGALDNLMKNRTTIVIAHRLSTIRKMDRILVMKNGAIIEEGTHDSLLDKKGEYAELWAHQSGGFLED